MNLIFRVLVRLLAASSADRRISAPTSRAGILRVMPETLRDVSTMLLTVVVIRPAVASAPLV
jgi:hypothetical protein